jgi:PAS domain-containing protein
VARCVPVASADDFGYLAMRTAVAHAGSMTTDSASTQHAVDTLRAALDEIELGTVLLDSDLHVQFVNSAFLRIYHLPDKSVVSGLDFEGLMRRVVGRRRSLNPASFNSYIKKRASEIRAGVEEPRDIRMDDGQVIRVSCKTLPDGGRMLVYANVTDLVQQADKLRELATVDGMTGLFNRRHFLSLAEIEWGRYQRHRRPISLLLLDIEPFQIDQRPIWSRCWRSRDRASCGHLPARETQIRRGGSLWRGGIPLAASGNANVSSPTGR